MIEQIPSEKFILDATAGWRMMWYDKHHPNALYIDQRAEVEPDQLADYRKLNYPDNRFKLIVFDPPHIVKQQDYANHDSRMVKDFGYLKADTMEADIKRAFKELWRVLAPYGVLIFKWNTTHVPSDRLIKLAPAPPLFYQVTHSKSGKDQSDHIRTVWFTFMKIPKEQKQDKLVNQLPLFSPSVNPLEMKK